MLIGNYASADQYIDRSSIAKSKIKIDDKSLKLFFDRITKFANEKGFGIRIALSDPRKGGYIIQMLRDDIMIVGVNVPDVLVFKLSFFKNGERPVETAITQSLIEAMKREIADGERISFPQD